LRFCTIVSNAVEQSLLVNPFPLLPPEPLGVAVGGGCYQSNGVVRIAGVLCAHNQAITNNDVDGTIVSLSPNLIGDPGSASGLASHDIVRVDPLLGPLADFGGFGPTHSLLPGSPAIDRADLAEAPPTDQRGIARPQGTRPDLGAFERETAPPPVSLTGLRLTESGAVGFSVAGVEGVTYAVEFSMDLLAWIPVGTNTSGGPQEYPITSPTGYYRVSVPASDPR
jgi:hypothetical protein